jgi:hypothetical protein
MRTFYRLLEDQLKIGVYIYEDLFRHACQAQVDSSAALSGGGGGGVVVAAGGGEAGARR